MAIMTRMRDSMPVILFGLLIAFLITIIFEWGMDYLGISAGRSDIVGEVNGKQITYKQFSDLLRSFSENQKAQTGVEPDEEALTRLREQVWETLVTQELIEEEVQRLGLTVTDQELINWVRGDNPPEDLRRNFVDSAGTFRKDLYDQFLSNPNVFIQDPEGLDQNFGTRWLADYEKTLRQRKVQEKLNSIILSSVRVSEGEVKQRFTDQNVKYDAYIALFDPSSLVKDEEVQIADQDLKKYYDEHLDQYRFDATRKLKYVMFLENPSASDTAARRNEIQDAYTKAISGIDFLQLVFTYSERPDSGVFFKHGELTPELEREVFKGQVGDIIGPIQQNDGFHLIKILDERKSDKEYVHASHILFSLDEDRDTIAVKATAHEVAKLAKQGEDFSSLAEQYSTDRGTASLGGDLGWFGRGRMVPAFEDAAFKASPGEVVGPIRSPFGLHIIKMHARDSRELKIASIVIPITASSQTKNDIFDRARDFTYNAKENEFLQEATSTGLEVKETQVQEKGGVIPGIGINESISRWAFNNKVGSVSEPFTIPRGYAVFTVVEAKDAGVKPINEVRESLRPLVQRKKKIEKTKQIAAEYKAKLGPGDNLSALSEKVPGLNVQQTQPFALTAGVPGVGRDQTVMGTVAGLSPGQISPPVEGLRGVYLVQVLSKTDFDSTAFAAQKSILTNQLLQEKRNRFVSEWISQLKEKADIKDNRELFFR